MSSGPCAPKRCCDRGNGSREPAAATWTPATNPSEPQRAADSLLSGALMGLQVLITNVRLWPPTGTVLYVRDLALELQRQGHTPIVFSSTVGEVVDELGDSGITVTADLGRIRTKPDIIHGHQHAPTLIAIRRWPAVPAIYVCHSHESLDDMAPIHPSIRRYFGVSRVCVRRLVHDGVPEDRAELLPNFVDTARFSPRAPLPERPGRALVFSNYADAKSHLPAVVEACRVAGLELDVIGAGVGRIATKPELVLGHYDVVFAKAKAAMEAMAVGTAVILCDYSGVGPMVTSAEFDALRPLNFGFEALTNPLQPEPLLREIARYDATDAARVRDLLRSSAGLDAAVHGLMAIYREAIAVTRSTPSRSGAPESSIRERLFLGLYLRWGSLPEKRRKRLKTVPGVGIVLRGLRRLLGEARR